MNKVWYTIEIFHPKQPTSTIQDLISITHFPIFVELGIYPWIFCLINWVSAFF